MPSTSSAASRGRSGPSREVSRSRAISRSFSQTVVRAPRLGRTSRVCWSRRTGRPREGRGQVVDLAGLRQHGLPVSERRHRRERPRLARRRRPGRRDAAAPFADRRQLDGVDEAIGLVGAGVAVADAEDAAAALEREREQRLGRRDRASPRVDDLRRRHGHVLAVGRDRGAVGGEPDGRGRARGLDAARARPRGRPSIRAPPARRARSAPSTRGGRSAASRGGRGCGRSARARPRRCCRRRGRRSPGPRGRATSSAARRAARRASVHHARR